MYYKELDFSNYTIRINRQVIERLKVMARERAYNERRNVSVASILREVLRKEYPHLFEGVSEE